MARTLAGARRRGAAFQRDHQSGGQCARRDARGRHGDDPHRERSRDDAVGTRHRHHAGRRLCAHRSRRHRHRHPEGASRQDLRSVLHHQAGRPGHGPWPRHRLRHRQADGRLHHRGQRSRQGHDLPHLSAALSHRRKRAGRRRSPSAQARATSPARTRSFWSKTKKRCAASPRARCACAATPCSRRRAAKRRSRSCSKRQGADPSAHHRRRDAQHGRADAGARGETHPARDGA